MAAYSAFQSSGFQNNAFQIIRGSSDDEGVILLGGGPGYPHIPPHQRYREEEYQRRKVADRRAELERIDDEIADAERKRLKALADAKKKRLAKKKAKELADLEAMLQQEINRLRIERAWLMRRIDDEETILVLLMRKRKRIF